jgi:hypothetical protein
VLQDGQRKEMTSAEFNFTKNMNIWIGCFLGISEIQFREVSHGSPLFVRETWLVVFGKETMVIVTLNL